MSKPKVVTDVTRNVWDMDDLKAMQVTPCPDNDDWVTLKNFDKESESWFGKVDVSFPSEFAKQLGQALIDTANEVLAKGKNHG